MDLFTSTTLPLPTSPPSLRCEVCGSTTCTDEDFAQSIMDDAMELGLEEMEKEIADALEYFGGKA